MATQFSRRQLLRISAAAGVAAAGAPLVGTVSEASASVVPPKVAWWYAARFGMFIHFGSYSALGHGEWAFSNEGWSKAAYQRDVTGHFNPTSFSAASIVGLARSAGMKYLVITAKHHEGFAMWDSRVPSFTDTTGSKLYTLPSSTPYQEDLLAALKAECDRQGIRFGLYYSILDWNHSSQTIRHTDTTFSTMASPTARSAYIDDMKAQLRELVTRYDPAIMWFDGDWCANPETPTLADWWIKADGESLAAFLTGLKPDLVINERVKRDLGLGDFLCPEQTVPAAPLPRLWETCQTLNGAWGYDDSRENSYKAPGTVIRELVTVASRDGNYLLNIGPKGDGTATPGSVSVLHAVGAWMAVYGAGIYDTSGSPFSTEPSWGRFTKQDGRLYALVSTWPTGGALPIPALRNTVSRAYLLNDPGTALPFSADGGPITVTVPADAPDPYVSVVVLEVDGLPAPPA